MSKEGPGKSPEARPVSREEVVKALIAGGENDPIAKEMWSRWQLEMEGMRDKGEMGEDEIFITSTSAFIEGGLHEIAVEECRKVLKGYDTPGTQEDGMRKEPTSVYDFCMDIISKYG